MAKNEQDKKSKTAVGVKSGGRNADRRNGKAWGRNHRSDGDQVGHNPTGRTKPSGNTFGGHSLKKISPEGLSGSAIDAARNTQHRASLRQSRKAEAARAARQSGNTRG